MQSPLKDPAYGKAVNKAEKHVGERILVMQIRCRASILQNSGFAPDGSRTAAHNFTSLYSMGSVSPTQRMLQY